MFNKIKKNEKNEATFHLRTDNKKYELLYKDAKKSKKSINLIMNEIIAKHYEINVEVK